MQNSDSTPKVGGHIDPWGIYLFTLWCCSLNVIDANLTESQFQDTALQAIQIPSISAFEFYTFKGK
jgi:hypothetical protein